MSDLSGSIPDPNAGTVLDLTGRSITKKTLDEWLDEVDYTWLNDGSYVPSEFSLIFTIARLPAARAVARGISVSEMG